MPTFHIHIKGCVQGVGFRPFVYRQALSLGLNGWVSNTPGGVHIEINASAALAEKFYRQCIDLAPRQSKITGQGICEVPPNDFEGFTIRESQDHGAIDLSITPDFGICPSCLSELTDHNDRRFGYPFITCTQCGPRYSVINHLPYDRHLTTMTSFSMCDHCNAEYEDPGDRRYYSQTNSCARCGVSLFLSDAEGNESTGQEVVLSLVHEAFGQGKIVAVKGIGGYLLLCNATDPGPIALLRQRKHRPAKPFAVMYPNAALLEKDVFLTADQEKSLQGPVAPIHILPIKPASAINTCHELISPGLHSLGVMLPYAPLLALIAHRFGKPLVATSANLTGSPIIHRDEQAREELFRFADLLLSHDREIVMPGDDSVIKVGPLSGSPIILRRSRGLAPSYHQRLDLPSETLLALGAEMKGSFSISTGSNLYVSQYLGNLSGYEAQQTFKQVLTHFLSLVKAEPRALQCDLHPGYFTTSLAQELSFERQLPIHVVQHHEAHFAAVLGENDLLDTSLDVLGVVWDGTGYGHDGQVWGGEFFTYNGDNIRRIQHFDYFPWLAGDKMAKEPRLSAFSITGGSTRLKDAFREDEWKFYAKLLTRPGLQTSSVGRLFDAVSSLMGVLQQYSYEGQAGLLLEQMAYRFFESHKWEKLTPFDFKVEGGIITVQPMIDEMIDELPRGTSMEEIAARFHQTLVSIIEKIAVLTGHQHIAFSGGVFQNAVLVDLIQQQLSANYQLYFHRQLSPNDENISFGQVMHYYVTAKARSKQTVEEYH